MLFGIPFYSKCYRQPCATFWNRLSPDILPDAKISVTAPHPGPTLNPHLQIDRSTIQRAVAGLAEGSGYRNI